MSWYKEYRSVQKENCKYNSSIYYKKKGISWYKKANIANMYKKANIANNSTLNRCLMI